MYELKKNIGKVFTSKFVGTGPSPYEKRIYRAAVSQRLRNTGLYNRNRVFTARHELGLQIRYSFFFKWLITSYTIRKVYHFLNITIFVQNILCSSSSSV